MRYLKFSILTGIGLFALAMFFLSQSMQDFLNLQTETAQTSNDLEILDFSLAEPESFPDLNLDFPAGSDQSKTTLSQSPHQSHLPMADQKGNHDHRLHSAMPPERKPSQINLLHLQNQQAAEQQSLNILLLTQTTKQQRTTLIEELIRLDADLVRQIAFKPTFQQDHTENKFKGIQQTSLNHAAETQTVSAGYKVPQNSSPRVPPQNSFLIQKETPIHLITSFRGAKIKTIGIAQQNGSLNQTIQVIPLISNTVMNATVLGSNLAKLNLTLKLPAPEALPKPAQIRLSRLGEFQPSEIIKLTGVGLVVGLKGSGDRGYTTEAIQALKSSIKTMNIDLDQIKTPIESGNLANVSIIAHVPNTGVTKGQRLKCYVTADNETVNLTGGYLLPMALLDAGSFKTNADAIGMGPILTDPSQKKSQAVITAGAQILSNLRPNLISSQGLPHLKFFLKNPSGQPTFGQLVTQNINQFLKTQHSENTKALLRSSSMIMISLPNSDQQQAQNLAARLLSLEIPSPLSTKSSQNPELIIDTTKTEIQTRGTVLLQPAKIDFNHFTLEIAPSSPLTTTRLKDLLTLMQHMQIPETKQILFLRTLQQQGKIRATYREF
ncbi:MAG: flagellar basal body P-ring protein FlgI [Planctomycetes bacterium]|nr:flagellar basal body P-ring protein FlgI [Planctomycetota bacterium]MCH9726144.1 flagellar basal body P-ring protein FlgI [Planctomycetota bacterium]MCH9775650.1 flagellar basal body P-ring protein FlgI [Planctomycetota bacterium]MCH9792578.1 flagellar basal body P-ring protein FlgI [Planctomycetota bacterium]